MTEPDVERGTGSSKGDDESPDVERYYETLRHYVRMVARDHKQLMMLDAEGGLGKTHQVRDVLREEVGENNYVIQNGFTTPVELFKTLYRYRGGEQVIFLDDIDGITKNKKALNMLKSATDTEGSTNYVEYRSTSHTLDEIPVQRFQFDANIVMAFNDAPDNAHTRAFRSRGIDYKFRLDHEERLDIINELANADINQDLTQQEHREVAEWLTDIARPHMDITLRTYIHALDMKAYSDSEDTADWRTMMLDQLGGDEESILVHELATSSLDRNEQILAYMWETGKSKRTYYNKLNEYGYR